MPIDAETGMVEPDIIINGRALTFAECLTMRVAIAQLGLWLGDPEIRSGVGEQLAVNYTHHMATIAATMTQGTPGPRDWDAVTVGDVRAALAALPDQVPICEQDFMGHRAPYTEAPTLTVDRDGAYVYFHGPWQDPRWDEAEDDA